MRLARRRSFLWRRLTVWAVVLALLSLALLSLAPVCLARAQDVNTMTLAEYRTALEQARAQIAANGNAAVQETAVQLAAITAVELPDGSQTTLTPLVLPGDSQARALARLDAVIAQLKAAEDEDDAARLASLDRVLASDEMNRGSGLWAWLLRLLARLFGQGSGDAVNGGFDLLDTLITVVAAIVLVFILGRILQAALGNFMREADVRQARDDEERITVAGARRRAADLAQAGSYREAVRQLYLATLLSLEDRGLLRIDRSLTNREVLQSVGRWAEVQGGLRPVVDTFEAVWYGEREPDRETFERYSAEVASASDLIERAAPLPTVSAPAVEAA